MKLSLVALGLITALTPALADAGNTQKRLFGESFWTVKQRLADEIGSDTRAISKVWDCTRTRCEKNVAEWYLPKRNLYVRLTGGAMATHLEYGPQCTATDCALVARLTR